MRRLFLLALLAPALPAQAEITSLEGCTAAIGADAEAAREDAAQWSALGGGTPARLCEAAALEAMGAHATAARLLQGLAQNANRALPAMIRAVILEDAARLWLDAGEPGEARAALAAADGLAPAEPVRLKLRARTEAAEGDWAAARETLDGVLRARPDDAMALALRAATRRKSGDAQGALADAEAARAKAPDLPEASFETAAALAKLGRPREADALWLDLIARHPSSPLAADARANLQTLSAAAPAPILLRPGPPRPYPRPADWPPG